MNLMDRLRSVLPKVLKKRGLYHQASASHITHAGQRWLEESLGNLGSFVSIKSYSQGTLTIACAHSVAAQECQALLPAFREYLSREFPDHRLLEVRLVRETKATKKA
jgi:hypothetical protein